MFLLAKLKRRTSITRKHHTVPEMLKSIFKDGLGKEVILNHENFHIEWVHTYLSMEPKDFNHLLIHNVTVYSLR